MQNIKNKSQENSTTLGFCFTFPQLTTDMKREKCQTPLTLILPVLQYLSEGESLDEVVRKSMAVFLFVEWAVSMERAAVLSELSIVEFIAILGKRNISWSEYTDEHFKQDHAFIQ